MSETSTQAEAVVLYPVEVTFTEAVTSTEPAPAAPEEETTPPVASGPEGDAVEDPGPVEEDQAA